VIFVVLPLIGWGRLVAERNGVLGTETGVALMVVAGLASFTVGVAITARKLNEADRVLRRRSADTASRLSTLVESSHDAILTVRPDGVIAGWNAAAEAMFGYVADEAIGAHITLITPSELREETESVLVSALNAQAVTDRETVRTTKDGRALDVSITVWPLHDGNGETIGVSAIICDITARKEAEAELRRTMARLGQAKADLEASRAETIRRLTRAVEHRDDETGAHVERMSRYCGLIARELGLSPALCDVIATASPMHDVGKIAVPDAILYKPGPLTDDERATMQLHAEEGYRILAGSGAELLEMAATIALSHHERVDGTGYPRGLRGDAIPLAGRIAAVADVFDALTSDRPYRAALSLDETLAIMRDGRGTHFDPEIFDAFLRVLARPDQGDAAHDELALWRAYPPEQARI
jgi:PAS domain S-box-containing protein